MSANDKTVLVIDDSPTVRRLAEIVLTQANYTVYTAEDGDEGLEVTKKIHPSIILVDFVMPKMNGYKFCKILRSDDKFKDIPIILITSKGEDVGQKFEEQFGVVHYFTKPFEPDELIGKLENVLEETAEPVETAPVATAGAEMGDSPEAIVAAVQEKVDRVVRSYFQKDFPLLMKRVLSDTLRETGLVKDDTLILTGRVTHVSLPDILHFAHVSRLSGRLSVISKTIFGEIFLESGMFVFATVSKRDAQTFLTDLLREDGKIDDQQLGQIVEEARDRSLPVGKILLEKSIITEEELTGYLKNQAQSAFNDILSVSDGNFYLENAPLPVNLQDISFRTPLPGVLVEGLRLLDERQMASEALKDESVVFMRLITSEDVLESVHLNADETRIFSLVDGRKRLNEIISESGLDSGDVKRICYSLQKIGLLRIKDS